MNECENDNDPSVEAAPPSTDVMRLLAEQVGEQAADMLEKISTAAAVYVVNHNHTVMAETLDKLLREAPCEEGAAPAIEAMLQLAGLGDVQGIVSFADDDQLVVKVLVPGQQPNGQPIMVERFFRTCDIRGIAVKREVLVRAPAEAKIWTPT